MKERYDREDPHLDLDDPMKGDVRVSVVEMVVILLVLFAVLTIALEIL